MAANPQLVNTDIAITYDGVSQRIMRGTIIDMPAGSALANAPATVFGSSSGTLSSHVTPLTSQQTQDSLGGVAMGPATYENTGINGGNPTGAGMPFAYPQ